MTKLYQLSTLLKFIRHISFNAQLSVRIYFLIFLCSFNVKLMRWKKTIFCNAFHKTNETCNQPMLSNSKFMLSRFNEINSHAFYDRFQARARWYNR